MKTNTVLAMVILALVVVATAWYFKDAEMSQSIPLYDDSIRSTAPADTLNSETGEVDQEAFEENQAISDDDSLETIEAELDNTVILQEDFSDL